MRLFVITVVSLGLATTAAHAEDRRQHSVHEHGHASMQVILEGAELAINIEAPGMDIVGFERAPEGGVEKRRIQQALNQLENAKAMFALPEKALCSVTEAHAEHAVTQADKDDDHSDHKDSHSHKVSDHSAFHAHYGWRCEKPEALRFIDVRYFEAFSATVEIEALIIGPDGQSAQELTAKSARIKF